MLTVAVRAARRRGLPLPVPVTLRFPGRAGLDEDAWQEDVAGALGIEDWRVVEIGEELDLLGPRACALMDRAGLLWPANLHGIGPVVDAAAGGSLITGIDGDGLLDFWQWRRAASVVARRTRPEPRDALRIVKAYGPRRLRREIIVRRERPFSALDWLTPPARSEITSRYAEVMAAEPTRWDRRLEWYQGHRYLRVLKAANEAQAAGAGVTMIHPLLDRRFLSALARTGGRSGFADRTAALQAIVGGVLPKRTIRRTSKADFTWAFWGPVARSFAEAWDGTGLDPALVDAERVREAWLAPKPDFRSASLLQVAHRASKGLGSES